MFSDWILASNKGVFFISFREQTQTFLLVDFWLLWLFSCTCKLAVLEHFWRWHFIVKCKMSVKMNVQIIQTECVHVGGWLSTNFLLHQSAFCWFLPSIERFCESGWTTKDYRIKKAFINQTLKHKSGCRQEDMRQLSGVIREKLESYFLVEACCIPLTTAFWRCAIYDTVKLKMKSMTSVLKLKKNIHL